jgi:hypothetical protein
MVCREEKEMFAVKSDRRNLRATRLATTAMTAMLLMTGLSACSQKSPEAPIESRELEYPGKIVVEVITLDDGKKVNCAVAAANGVSLTCDWSGAH